MNMTSRILIAVVSRHLKTPKKGAETKNKMLPCDLKKMKVCKWKFSSLFCTQKRKLGNLGNLLQFFTVIVTQDSNTTKKWTEAKTENSRYGLRTKNKHFWGFQVFGFCPVTIIENSEILEMFLPQILTLVVTPD